MKIDSSNFVLKLLVAGGAGLLIVMLVLTVQSFYRLFTKPPAGPDNAPVPAAAITTGAEEEDKHLSVPAEHAFQPPASVPAPNVALAAPPAVKLKPADLTTEAEKIRQREKGRLEMIENMRKWAREHNNTNELKKLQEIEKSGSEFL